MSSRGQYLVPKKGEQTFGVTRISPSCWSQGTSSSINIFTLIAILVGEKIVCARCILEHAHESNGAAAAGYCLLFTK